MSGGIGESKSSPPARVARSYAILATGAHALSLDDNANSVSEKLACHAPIFFEKALALRHRFLDDPSIETFQVRQRLYPLIGVYFMEFHGFTGLSN